MKSTVLAIFLCIGVVDQVDNEMASVQVTTSDQSVRELQMSTLIFPCNIKEGDTFYFEYSDGVTKIRCGTPRQKRRQEKSQGGFQRLETIYDVGD